MKKTVKFILIVLSAVMIFGACQKSDIPQNTEESSAGTNPPPADPVMLLLVNAAPASPEGAGELQLKFNLALLWKNPRG